MAKPTEKILYQQQPSAKVVFTWVSSRMLWNILFWIVIGSFIISSDPALRTFSFLITVVPIFLVVLIIGMLVFYIIQARTYTYTITTKGAYFAGGTLIKRQVFVPFAKITNIEVTQNFIEQMVGVSTLGIQTAGASGRMLPEITFEGLEDVEIPRKIMYDKLKY